MESNIFKALKMAQDEVLMCRFLADLLDPKGHKSAENKLDTSFLKSFLEVCLQMDCAKGIGISVSSLMPWSMDALFMSATS